MNKPIELCWTCRNLNGNKCPIKLDINKVNKFHGTQTVVTTCKKHDKITT